MTASGLVVVDKPAGITSHDVVARVRRLAGTRKVGHAGTLDPMATGVLVLGVERATRLLGHLMLTDKSYDATIRLGVATAPFGRTVETRTPAGLIVPVPDTGPKAVAAALAWAVDQPADVSIAKDLADSGASKLSTTDADTGISDTDWLDHEIAAVRHHDDGNAVTLRDIQYLLLDGTGVGVDQDLRSCAQAGSAPDFFAVHSAM